MEEYRTSESCPRLQEEYRQWARILTRGNPAHGMLLVLIQKLCTAVHEIEAACRREALNEQQLDFFRRRLSIRVGHVLDTIEDNDLHGLGVMDDFRKLLDQIAKTQTLDELADLAESVHRISHAACDALESSE